MRDARIVISNDSGPVHIAAALKIPVAAIFGPTSPVRTGPYGEGHAVLRSPADCSPCFKKRCSDMRCMKGITPEAVYEQVLLLLQKRVG
jgi:ADP-heptose:LPS heptosyltransferase